MRARINSKLANRFFAYDGFLFVCLVQTYLRDESITLFANNRTIQMVKFTKQHSLKKKQSFQKNRVVMKKKGQLLRGARIAAALTA